MMSPTLARTVVLSAALSISQAAAARDRLQFWTAGGEHGIDACAFITMPMDGNVQRLGRVMFGVSGDPETLEAMGRVKLRQAGNASGRNLLEIGAGSQLLLSVTLIPTQAGSATADVPGKEMENVLRSLLRQPDVWVRIGDAAGATVEQASLEVAGDEADLSSCLSVLRRDLAQEYADRAAGAIRLPPRAAW